MNRITSAFLYLKHRFCAIKWDAFHSPYLFELFTYCCDEKQDSVWFLRIEDVRRKLTHSEERIERLDLGEGSSWDKNGPLQKISAIASRALSLPYQCRFLFRLAAFTKAQRIIEFGTSLGISSAYLAASTTQSQVITIEGDSGIAEHASKVFDELGLTNIRVISSSFEDFILNQIPRDLKIDFLFLDGNHNAKALIGYYTSLRPFFHSSTIVVIDDIYWSFDMQRGWQQLISMPEITQSIDCFHFGLLLFNKDFLNRENHRVRLPWRSILSNT